jgi:gluconate 2-dehydrogenase subunit 3-like protein
VNDSTLPRLDRRTAIKWMLTAYASLSLAPHLTFGQRTSATSSIRGYGTDPDLTKSYSPGDFWPLTLTEDQRKAVIALCDVILPADDKSPSASAVGVPDFIDEWISAPYDANRHDRELILNGLTWLETESNHRFGVDFARLSPAQHKALCDDICFEQEAKAEFKTAAQFFARFRDLTAGGYYTTPEGMKDIGYIGNVPLPTFEGPPEDLIKRLGLA